MYRRVARDISWGLYFCFPKKMEYLERLSTGGGGWGVADEQIIFVSSILACLPVWRVIPQPSISA